MILLVFFFLILLLIEQQDPDPFVKKYSIGRIRIHMKTTGIRNILPIVYNPFSSDIYW